MSQLLEFHELTQMRFTLSTDHLNFQRMLQCLKTTMKMLKLALVQKFNELEGIGQGMYARSIKEVLEAEQQS